MRNIIGDFIEALKLVISFPSAPERPRLHVSPELDDPKLKYKCTNCNKWFSNYTMLERHRVRHTQQTSNPRHPDHHDFLAQQVEIAEKSLLVALMKTDPLHMNASTQYNNMKAQEELNLAQTRLAGLLNLVDVIGLRQQGKLL